MLQWNVGCNRKNGETNFGSRGAAVNVRLELASGLSREPEKLKQRIRRLIAPARASVDEDPDGAAPAETDGHGRQRDAAREDGACRARSLQRIVDRRRLDLADLRRRRCGVDAAGDPTITRNFILKRV